MHSTDCIKKNGTVRRKKILDMIFFQNVCVFGIILKQINCSFCCFLNHIICFCKSRVMLCFVRQGKIPFVPLFIFIEEIVMEVLATKKLICEDNDERNYWDILKYDSYYLVAHTQTHTHAYTHTHTHIHTHSHLSFCSYVMHSNWCVCVCVYVRVRVYFNSSTCTNIPYIQHTHAN